MMQHSASIALRSEGGSPGQDLAGMDWSRHDPAEREFYANATEQLNKFKQAVNWNNMQRGVAAEELSKEIRMAPGTTQLDSFVPESGGLTGQGPPTIALEDDSEPISEIEHDEEDLLAKADEFPELAGAQPVSETPEMAETTPGESHAAAMELAPSKKKEEMESLRSTFVDGAVKKGVNESYAANLFDQIEQFAGYGFNRSHSVGYALIAYQTAWLKAHYPAEFMASVLSCDLGNTDNIQLFVDDCKNIDTSFPSFFETFSSLGAEIKTL